MKRLKMDKVRILFVNPGPIYNVSTQWGQRLIGMSEWAEGCFLATSPQTEHPLYGSFEAQMVFSNSGRGARVIVQSIWALLRMRLSTRRRFDLVVSYDPLRSGLLAWFASRLNNCPYIVEVNGVYTSPYVSSEFSSLKRKVRDILIPKVMKFTLKRSAGVKLLFAKQVETFDEQLRGKVVRVFPNLVNTKGFKSIEDKKEVLSIGMPFHLKGMDVLVEAFKLVANDFPEWRLKILGWYPDRAEIDAVVGQHPRIEIHPPVKNTEMPDHMGRCGVFVLASRTEAMGRVLVEAMAAGKPRIGSAVDGIPTVIENGLDGLLFTSENAQELTACLRLLMGDEALRHRLGERGALRAATDFTPESYFERTKKLYHEVLSAYRA